MISRNKARQWIQNEAASSTLSSTPLLHVHIVLLAASICIHCIDTGGNIEEVQHCIWRRKRTNGNSAPEQSEDEGCKVDLGGIHTTPASTKYKEGSQSSFRAKLFCNRGHRCWKVS